MPAVFQRLWDAIRVVMLQRTPVDALLGMLDDFLGVVYRRPGETDKELFLRGRRSAQAFDQELIKMGIEKQSKKDSPIAWKIVWLGFELDTRRHTLGIPSDKQQALIHSFHADFMNEGAWRKAVGTKALEKLVGTLCHFIQAWPLGKTLLWPMYMVLNEYRGFNSEGKPIIRKGTAQLNGECRESLDEWYYRMCTHGLEKKFNCCRGSRRDTVIGIWMIRGRRRQRKREGEMDQRKGKAIVRLESPWCTTEGSPAARTGLAGKGKVAQQVATAITLLMEFLENYAERCGEVVEVRTNLGRFATYITKECYPKGLNRQSYLDSIAIHRSLERTKGERELAPRELKAFFIC